MIPYIDNTVTLTTSDTLVITDQIILDQDLTLTREDTDHGTNDDMDYRSRYYSIWNCSPIVKSGSETNPQIYVPSTAAGNYKIDLAGSWHLSSRQPKALLVGEDADHPLPYNWSDRSDSSNRTFELEFSNQISGQSEYGFITGSLVGYRYGKLAGIELWGTKPPIMWATLKSDALAGQATVVLNGDLSNSWAVGDNIMCGGARYSSTRNYRSWAYNEIREIQSITYSAENDDTTIVFTTNLGRNHYYDADIPPYFTLKERNIIVGGNDTTYNAESYWSIQNGIIKMQGVLLHDIQYIHYRYSYAKYMSAQEKIDSKCLFDGCNIHDCYRPMYFQTWQTEVEVCNCTGSSDLTGTTLRCDRFYYSSYAKNHHIHNNIIIGRTVYGVTLGGSSDCIVENNHFNVRYAIALSSGAAKNNILNNTFGICRVGMYMAGCSNNHFENNIYRECRYDSNYSAASESTHGCYSFNTQYNNSNNISENEDADRSFTFVNQQNDAGSTHVFKNIRLGVDFTGGVVSEGGANYRSAWNPGTEIKFEDYNEAVGQSKAWYTNGYIESCGEGLEDTTAHTTGVGKKSWRLNSYFAGVEHCLEFTIPIGVPDEPITISIFCKINSLNYAIGIHKPPKLSISGLGVSGVSTECEADITITDWQLLVVSGTPIQSGQLKIKLSIETDAITTQLSSLNTDGSVYFDDLYVAYKTPLDLGGLDLIYNGLPIFPPLTVVMTASAVWAEQLSANNQPGSMGEAQNKLNPIKIETDKIQDIKTLTTEEHNKLMNIENDVWSYER